MRKSKGLIMAAALLGMGFSGAAQAVPVVGPTGNFYDFIAGTINWANARTAALALSHDGQPGYLATITSAAENTFLFPLSSDGWIGGTDQDTEGTWIWADGPEAGQVFWIGGSGGAAPAGAFASWGGGEPNNSGGEDFAHYSGGTWNDLGAGSTQGGFFVEFNPAQVDRGVPAPATLALLALGLGLGVLGAARRRR